MHLEQGRPALIACGVLRLLRVVIMTLECVAKWSG